VSERRIVRVDPQRNDRARLAECEPEDRSAARETQLAVRDLERAVSREGNTARAVRSNEKRALRRHDAERIGTRLYTRSAGDVGDFRFEAGFERAERIPPARFEPRERSGYVRVDHARTASSSVVCTEARSVSPLPRT
jgi:predicted RNA-binding protein YlqC (UPF0109 family)